LIDDARIYQRALSANEVYILHELGNPTTTPETNEAPVNLSLNNLLINENQAVGSTVGQFSATDPDGHAITFQLVNGAGDTGNSLFSLETNGTLKTAVVFDYENNASSYSIRVQTKDESNNSTEGNFTIYIDDILEDLDQDGIQDHLDEDDDGDGYSDDLEVLHGFDPRDEWSYPNLPLTRTISVTEDNQTLSFSLEVLTLGGFSEVSAGVLIFDESQNLIKEANQSVSSESVFYFNLPIDHFPWGKKIFYKSYAENTSGRTFGQILEHFVGGEYAINTWWVNDSLLSAGWRDSSWMGIYLPNRKNDWIYHLTLGWLYTRPDGNGGFWYWMPKENWLWSIESAWPFLWSESSGGWLYPIYSSGKLHFYDYKLESIR
jgi:hypothetical protein